MSHEAVVGGGPFDAQASGDDQRVERSGGAFQGGAELRGRGALGLQLAGLAGFSAVALLALPAPVVDAGWAPWVLAAGWYAHAAWDFFHHRSGAVVPRAWSEWCGVVDAAGATAVVLLAL
ncbi:hypothetical protein [Streptomyces sp. W1SF4]|uniref:hypothetical protein n=1 Tax=Streptomyces sp. W1SF4 TaxID=2305220 RepID=UPI001F49E200|nr:hypothetical protein [Streptomyces sp. W1SF4]